MADPAQAQTRDDRERLREEVEVEEPDRRRRGRSRGPRAFVYATVAPGAIMHTDGWRRYEKIATHG